MTDKGMSQRVLLPRKDGPEIEAVLEHRDFNRSAELALPPVPIVFKKHRVQLRATVDIVGTGQGPAYEIVVHKHPMRGDRRCVTHRAANLEDAIMAGHSLCFGWVFYFLNPGRPDESEVPE